MSKVGARGSRGQTCPWNVPNCSFILLKKKKKKSCILKAAFWKIAMWWKFSGILTREGLPVGFFSSFLLLPALPSLVFSSADRLLSSCSPLIRSSCGSSRLFDRCVNKKQSQTGFGSPLTQLSQCIHSKCMYVCARGEEVVFPLPSCSACGFWVEKKTAQNVRHAKISGGQKPTNDPFV